MKLMTKQIEKILSKYPLYSQDGKGLDTMIVTKFFNPYGRGTWLVAEGEKQDDGDWLFFGYVKLLDDYYEAGYFKLSDIVNTKITIWGYKMPLERDLYFDPTPLKDINDYKTFGL